MCGAPDQDALDLTGVDLSKEAVVHGRVLRSGSPVPGAYVRLLDGTGEFTAEVRTSATGQFRFFAAPGDWTVRAITGPATVDAAVRAVLGQAAEARVELPA